MLDNFFSSLIRPTSHMSLYIFVLCICESVPLHCAYPADLLKLEQQTVALLTHEGFSLQQAAMEAEGQCTVDIPEEGLTYSLARKRLSSSYLLVP